MIKRPETPKIVFDDGEEIQLTSSYIKFNKYIDHVESQRRQHAIEFAVYYDFNEFGENEQIGNIYDQWIIEQQKQYL